MSIKYLKLTHLHYRKKEWDWLGLYLSLGTYLENQPRETIHLASFVPQFMFQSVTTRTKILVLLNMTKIVAPRMKENVRRTMKIFVTTYLIEVKKSHTRVKFVKSNMRKNVKQ